MYPAVIAVKPLKDHTLLLTFDNDEVRVFDVKPFLGTGMFRELRDFSNFDSVRVSFDTVEWANGADLCPEILYEQSVKFENCA